MTVCNKAAYGPAYREKGLYFRASTRQDTAKKNDSHRKTRKIIYNITMNEQQEKKGEAPAPAPFVHQELPPDTLLISEAVIELNIRGGSGLHPRFVERFLHLIRYQVPV